MRGALEKSGCVTGSNEEGSANATFSGRAAYTVFVR